MVRTERITMTSGLLSHKLVTRIVFTGKGVGLNIVHEHDGGRLTRNHLITVTGTPHAVGAFRNYVARVVEFMREGA